MTDAVVLQDVSQRFARRWVLACLSLAIPSGAAVLLTGDNGAGKTTLLRIMSTALRPSRGAVQLFGLAAQGNLHAVRPRLGLMTHAHGLYEALSARENLALMARLSGRGTSARQVELLERVRLGPHADAPVASYSAGMKRRCGLARLLMLEPELVFLDEPFTELDPAGVALMEQVVRDFRSAGSTVVLSTHDVERGAALCTHQLHLHPGAAAGLRPLGGTP